jgi:hypothetical protein
MRIDNEEQGLWFLLEEISVNPQEPIACGNSILYPATHLRLVARSR